MSEYTGGIAHTPLDFTRFVGIVDGLPETRGMGITVIANGTFSTLRTPSGSPSRVIVEVSSAPAGSSLPASAGRTPASSAPQEWMSLGFNCGGAVLAWIGVAGTGALAPVTGGLSATGTFFLWGGALGASGLCITSAYRVSNVYRGREDINAALDASSTYSWLIRGADVVGLVGAGGALREVARTGAVLSREGLSFSRAATSTLARPMRRRLTEAFDLQGAKRVSAQTINQVIRQRMLDAFAGALGMIGSTATGVIHEVNVWIASELTEQP